MRFPPSWPPATLTARPTWPTSRRWSVWMRRMCAVVPVLQQDPPEHPAQPARVRVGAGPAHRPFLPPAPAVRTHRDSGPVFESMRAQLAGIASHSGMAEVFELRAPTSTPWSTSNRWRRRPAGTRAASGCCTLRLCSESIALHGAGRVAAGAAGLQDKLGIQHAMVLMLDASAQQLYTVASCGLRHRAWFPKSGWARA